jgi:hypothetical protein
MQEEKMEAEALIDKRRKLGRIGVLIFLVAFGLRFLFRVNEVQTPVVIADDGRTGDSSSTHINFVRLAWLTDCAPSQNLLGLYAEGDTLCHPSRTVSLGWLQSQLSAAGILASGEYLEQAVNPNNAACSARILAGMGGQVVGWVCSDESGLYRTDAEGKNVVKAGQLWIQ